MINGKAMREFNILKAAFEIWKAKWIPYWENKKLVTCGQKGIYLTLYTKKSEVMIFASNTQNPKTVATKISFCPDKVFSANPKLKAYDAENGKEIKLDHKMVLDENFYSFSLPVKAHDFRAIIIKNEK